MATTFLPRQKQCRNRPPGASLARCTLRRQTPEVGAVCSNWARTDLSGGREATRVPTAIINYPTKSPLRSSSSIRAAKAATATIPIVFNSGADPVREGLVASFNRPGGNATGVNVLLSALEGKRLGLLREMVPNAALIAVLLNPAMPTFDDQVNDVQAAAFSVGQRLHILRASNDGEIDAAFATAAELRTGALLVGADPFLFTRRERLLGQASRYAIPAIYELREYAAAGGLMSYGIRLAEAYRLVGVYTGRILKGDRPADLPVQQLTKFEFVINLKTAKALDIEIPARLISFVDEVIE